MFKTLRCFARSDERGWEAICVDLDIAVEADTFENARTVLMEAVKAYIEAALQEEPAVCRQLLSRRSPFHVRAMWALRLTVHLLLPPTHQRVSQGREERPVSLQAGFDLPCPA
jgi:hypothetical protein